MKQLIKNQTISIDDHQRGMALGHFDDDNVDIHLDKKAKSGNSAHSFSCLKEDRKITIIYKL